ncbi:hypothetical protein SKAU_G00341350 [Synaphobranchus kaupii]|uniref:Uncharacterized protein n=1 Tax=Synaphobranchus kaupii TaxID=118154 RepID=A0A9Q1EN61_SYNKA|nr:hypothetical protein SKAU_G00341350 [Synaphobranchus kaupii]
MMKKTKAGPLILLKLLERSEAGWQRQKMSATHPQHVTATTTEPLLMQHCVCSSPLTNNSSSVNMPPWRLLCV